MRKVRRRESGQVLIDCIIQVTKLLVERGLEKENAVVIGQDVAQFLALHWSGLSVYFPAKSLALRLIEAELERNFDGTRDNILALARKHNTTERTIYEILRNVRERARETREQVTDKQRPQRGQ